MIRAHLPDLLKVEPNAMHILRNAADHRADFQRLFTYVVHRWISGEHEKDELESWQHFLIACAAAGTGARTSRQARPHRHLHVRRNHYRAAARSLAYRRSRLR